MASDAFWTSSTKNACSSSGLRSIDMGVLLMLGVCDARANAVRGLAFALGIDWTNPRKASPWAPRCRRFSHAGRWAVPRLRIPIGDADHARGPARAPVTLVEYGDFQCPYSGDAFWVLQDLERRFTRDLQFVYRHFPVTELHPFALLAAEAAEAAGVQDRFWDMHAMLFENQPDFELDALVGYAAALRLDVEAFINAIASHRHEARIRDDFMGGVRTGVNGTPCLFINGERFNGPTDALAAAIQEACAHPHPTL